MKKLNLTSTLFIALIALSTACKKELDKDPVVPVVPNTAATAKEFMEVFGPKVQNLKINTNVSNTFTLKGGTSITIPAGAFKKGGIVVTGEVVIEAREMLKRSDVLFSGTNTNHISGAPLASDGFIYLNASVNGINVDKALNEAIKIIIPTKRTGTTQIWEGVEKVGSDDQMAWQAPVLGIPLNGGMVLVGGVLVPDPMAVKPPIVVNPQSESTSNGFPFDMGNLGWMNCDVLHNYGNTKTTVRVEVINNPGIFASYRAFKGETFVFFCAKGDNVAAQLYTADGTNKVKSYDNAMPVGTQGKYISFSIKNSKYYYAELETAIVANQNISLSLVEVSETQMQQNFNAMNNY